MLNNEQEIWVPIIDFEGIYEVSTSGTIRNIRGLHLKTYLNNSGYECIKLYKGKVKTSKLVHRVVLENLYSCPITRLECNHVDGNKLNNHMSNLEWVTSSENKIHALATGLKTYNVPTLGTNKGKSSKYHNVTYIPSSNKWVAMVRHNKKNYGQKRFNSEVEAALHVNYIIDTYGFNRPKNIV